METWKHITGHMAMNWVKEKKPPVMCWYWAAVLPAVMQPLQQPEEGSLLFWWKRAIQSTVVQPEPDLTTGSQHVPIPALR